MQPPAAAAAPPTAVRQHAVGDGGGDTAAQRRLRLFRPGGVGVRLAAVTAAAMPPRSAGYGPSGRAASAPVWRR